jgi:nucleotide-binding universal stress UspA family protein
MILDLAREADGDLILVGKRGHGPLAGLVLGGVTLRVFKAASSPVLLVPAAQPTPGR